METDNTRLIIDENNDAKKTEAQKENFSETVKEVLASKKKTKEFVVDNKINETTESIGDEFENEIDQSLLEMEEQVGQVYDSDSDDMLGSKSYRSSDGSASDDDHEKKVESATNSQLIESSVLQCGLWDDATGYQQTPVPRFYVRRRLSECIEESESEDDEKAVPVNGTRKITPIAASSQSTEITGAKRKFTVTKATDDNHKPLIPKVEVIPVSILKKTPSPPSAQKSLLLNSPKKIRIEAQALKNITARQNSQTIHFPCASGNDYTTAKSLFSPQGHLNPHLDRRYFDTSLVEIRTSQTGLATSTKSLDDKNDHSRLDDDVWEKRNDLKHQESAGSNITKSGSSSSNSTISSSHVTVGVSFYHRHFNESNNKYLIRDTFKN